MTDIPTWEVFVRLALAAMFGAVLGIEREERGKDAGVRTHMLLALGAGTFGLVSVGAFAEANNPTLAPNVTVDLTRIASYVAAGVGFVGAGAILRGDNGVKGLTTAASLWVASAAGLSAGLGYWEAGLAASLIGVVSLRVGRLPRRLVRRRRRSSPPDHGSHPGNV